MDKNKNNIESFLDKYIFEEEYEKMFDYITSLKSDPEKNTSKLYLYKILKKQNDSIYCKINSIEILKNIIFLEKDVFENVKYYKLIEDNIIKLSLTKCKNIDEYFSIISCLNKIVEDGNFSNDFLAKVNNSALNKIDLFVKQYHGIGEKKTLHNFINEKYSEIYLAKLKLLSNAHDIDIKNLDIDKELSVDDLNKLQPYEIEYIECLKNIIKYKPEALKTIKSYCISGTKILLKGIACYFFSKVTSPNFLVGAIATAIPAISVASDVCLAYEKQNYFSKSKEIHKELRSNALSGLKNKSNLVNFLSKIAQFVNIGISKTLLRKFNNKKGLESITKRTNNEEFLHLKYFRDMMFKNVIKKIQEKNDLEFDKELKKFKEEQKLESIKLINEEKKFFINDFLKKYEVKEKLFLDSFKENISKLKMSDEEKRKLNKKFEDLNSKKNNTIFKKIVNFIGKSTGFIDIDVGNNIKANKLTIEQLQGINLTDKEKNYIDIHFSYVDNQKLLNKLYEEKNSKLNNYIELKRQDIKLKQSKEYISFNAELKSKYDKKTNYLIDEFKFYNVTDINFEYSNNILKQDNNSYLLNNYIYDDKKHKELMKKFDKNDFILKASKKISNNNKKNTELIKNSISVLLECSRLKNFNNGVLYKNIDYILNILNSFVTYKNFNIKPIKDDIDCIINLKKELKNNTNLKRCEMNTNNKQAPCKVSKQDIECDKLSLVVG